MKKGLMALLVFAILLSSITYAVTYGGRITRIQTFPGEKVKAEIEQAKSDIDQQNQEAILKLAELSNQVAQLNSDVEKMTTESANARTETNVQLSNILNAISNLKTQIDDIRDIKNLRTELPPLLEQPREIITPKILLYFSGANILLLLVVIMLVIFVRKEHDSGHKMTPHGHPELHEYIKQHVAKGVHINTIRHQLISHDWEADEVDQAIREVTAS